MGQMTYAAMYGCRLPELPAGKTWWGDSAEIEGKWVYSDGLLESFKSETGREPTTDEESNVVGFFVAVGASGRDGVPYLEGPINLSNFAGDERYGEAIERARTSWWLFAAFCDQQGVALSEPCLWLVETEVA